MPSNHIPFTTGDVRWFRSSLLRWFGRNRRPLPWRETRDPYRVWISEIMLQQTRVAAVLEHYAEFLRRFPRMDTLAAAKLHNVLAAWSGLGYYRRARALHRATRIICRDHGGQLPSSSAALRELPGVGRYTAAAIASIAFGEPCAVVDGNVERVLRRVFGWRAHGMTRIWDAAQLLLSRRACGNFNQAMMELGALICLPASPRCNACPVRRLCATRGSLGPVAKPRRNTARITYGLAVRDGRVYLVRRNRGESLMPGMWELPRLQSNAVPPEFTLRHSITITDYTVHVCRVAAAPGVRGRWFPLPEATVLPLTGLARRILRRTSLI